MNNVCSYFSGWRETVVTSEFLFTDDELGLYVVGDGHGSNGFFLGDDALQRVVGEVLVGALRARHRDRLSLDRHDLAAAFAEAVAAVESAAKEKPRLALSACSLVAALWSPHDELAYVAQAGNCLAYVSDGVQPARQLLRSHARLLRLEEGPHGFPLAIWERTRGVGRTAMKDGNEPELVELRPGPRRLILVSNAIPGDDDDVLTPAEITRLAHAADPARALVDEAMARGQLTATAIVLRR